MHRQGLMRFKNSFSLLPLKVKKLFLPFFFFQNIYFSLLNLNSKKFFFPFLLKSTYHDTLIFADAHIEILYLEFSIVGRSTREFPNLEFSLFGRPRLVFSNIS